MKHQLERISKPGEKSTIDPNFPYRYYVEPVCEAEMNVDALVAGTTHKSLYKLPDGVECDHCVLQWYWVTGNSCNAIGYKDHKYPTSSCGEWWNPKLTSCVGESYPEEWWNCADVSITRDGAAPAPAPSPVPAPSTNRPSAAAQPTSTSSPAPATTATGSGSETAPCISINPQATDAWCEAVKCDPVYSDFCTRDPSYTVDSNTPPAGDGPAPAPGVVPVEDGGSGACVSIRPQQVTDEWCQAVKCDPVYADFCSSSGGANPATAPVPVPVSPQPAPSGPAPVPANPAPVPEAQPQPAPAPEGTAASGGCVSIAKPQISDKWCQDVKCDPAYSQYCSSTGATSPVPAPTAPVPAPTAPMPAPTAPAPGPVNPVEPRCGAITVAYYAAWSIYGRKYFITDIKFDKIDRINYAFANIDGTTGEVVLGDKYADTEYTYPGMKWDDPIRGNFGQLIKAKQQYPHLKVLISIGGWTWSKEFSQVAKSLNKRERFASSAVEFMRKYQLDGIDIDWEYPVAGGLGPWDPTDKENFTKLLQLVRQKLDAAGSGYLLTIATSASHTYARNMDVPAISKVIDSMNIMTYDFNGAWSSQTGHNAPLYANPSDGDNTWNSDYAVRTYMALGLPKDKLIVGLPMYGRSFAGAAAGPDGDGAFQSFSDAGPGTWENGIMDYDDIMEKYLAQGDWARHWDHASRVPYIYSPSKKVFISYDDVESIAEKSRYINAMGVAGGMWWDLSSDRGGALLSTATAEFTKGCRIARQVELAQKESASMEKKEERSEEGMKRTSNINNNKQLLRGKNAPLA